MSATSLRAYALELYVVRLLEIQVYMYYARRNFFAMIYKDTVPVRRIAGNRVAYVY